MKKGMTIKQIAEEAGVYIETVYRIINHQNFGYSQETYKRVQEIIGETGYMPNRVARSMITKRSFTIVYLVEEISNPFFPEIAKGINSVAFEKGFNRFRKDVKMFVEKSEILKTEMADGVVRRMLGYGDKIMS